MDNASDLYFSGDSGAGGVNLNSQTFAITGINGVITSADAQNILIDTGSLDTRITSNTTNITTNSSAILTETDNRENADIVLQDNIDAEASTRSGADDTLQNNIDAEETARIAGDANLQNQINTLPSPNDATITLTAGGGLTGGGDFTTDQASNETLTITHADTTRTNTTSSSTLSYDGSFTAITSVNTNSLGHITGANTETYTLPSVGAGSEVSESPIIGATLGTLWYQPSLNRLYVYFSGIWKAITTGDNILNGGLSNSVYGTYMRLDGGLSSTVFVSESVNGGGA